MANNKLEALLQAINYHSNREATPQDVLATAEIFENYLEGFVAEPEPIRRSWNE